jgi:hypothetical protein
MAINHLNPDLNKGSRLGRVVLNKVIAYNAVKGRMTGIMVTDSGQNTEVVLENSPSIRTKLHLFNK